MTALHAAFVKELKGAPTVLLAFDRESLGQLRSLLHRAADLPGRWTMRRIAVTRFAAVVEPGAARVTFQRDDVALRLPASKLAEVLDKLEALDTAARPGHHYVDIDAPCDTLMLSVDEYI